MQRALDQALNLAAKRGEEVEAMREALREAQEGEAEGGGGGGPAWRGGGGAAEEGG